MLPISATEPIVDRKALEQVQAETERLLAAMDRNEKFVEPMLSFFQASDRVFLEILRQAARSALAGEVRAREMLAPGVEHLSADRVQALLKATNDMQERLSQLHAHIGVAGRNVRDPNVLDMAQVVRECYERIYDLLEEARWEAMHREANLDIAQGRVHKFDSMEDAIASLRRLMDEPPSE